MPRRPPLIAVLTVLLSAGLAVSTSYNSPDVDGHIVVEPADWDADELAAEDPTDDCRYGGDTDLYDLYMTWSADSLYVGFRTDGGPGGFGNGLVVYLDTDAQNGITGATDFNDSDFYGRNITFSTMGVDVIVAGWDGGSTIPFEARDCTDVTSTVPIDEFFSQWNPGWREHEFAISWNGLYGLGHGVVPAGTRVRAVAATVGGDGSGAFDAVPTTSTEIETDPGYPWDAVTDLDLYAEVPVDANGDGIPDRGYPPQGRISGTVTLDEPGDLTTVATVTAYVGDVEYASAETPPGGGPYSVTSLAAGTYDLIATAPSYLSDSIEGVVVATDTTEVTGQDFVIQFVTGRIEGDVALTGGGPAVDVTVTAYDAVTGEIGGTGPFLVVGGTGPFSIGTLLDGPYEVVAEGKGYVEASVDTIVANGDTTEVGTMELPVVVATQYAFTDSLGNTILSSATTVSIPDDTLFYFAEAWLQPRDDDDRIAYWDETAQDSVLLTATRLDPAYPPNGTVVFADGDTVLLADSMITADMFDDARAEFLTANDAIEVLRVQASRDVQATRDAIVGVFEVGIKEPEPVRLELISDVDTLEVFEDVARIIGQLKDASDNDAKVQGVGVDMQALGVGGAFSVSSPETDANGRFGVDFGGLNAGVAYVTGIIDQSSAYANLPVDTLEMTLLPGDASTVVLSANPAALTDGGVSEITARVQDDWGNGVELAGLSVFLEAVPAGLVESLDSPIVTNAEGVATGELVVGSDYGMLEIAGSGGALTVESLFVPIDATIIATDEQAPESDPDHNSDPGADLTILRVANSADTLVVTHDFYSAWAGMHLAVVLETHANDTGASDDPFTFPIGYTHPYKPDYAFTYKYSDHAGEEYADLRRWNINAWQFYDFVGETWVSDWNEGVRAEGYVTKTDEKVAFRLPFAPLETAVGETVRVQGYIMQETAEGTKYNALDSVPHDATHDMLPDEGDWWETATDSVYLSNYAKALMLEEGFPPDLSDGLASPSPAQPGAFVTYTVDVGDGGGGVGDVFIDLSDIGGSSLVRMTDDGVFPDGTAGDFTYTAGDTLTRAASDGEHTLTVTARDAANIWPTALGILLDVDNPATALRSFEDDIGDDHGPNQLDDSDVPVTGLYYFYPTNFVFGPGSFDITGVDIFTDGDWIVFRTHLQDLVSHQEAGAADWGAPQPSAATCDNPNRTDLNLQKIDIYIDAVEGKGSTAGFPNRYVDVAPVDAWDYGISVEGWGKWFVVSNDSPSIAAWDLFKGDSDIRMCDDHVENYVDVAVDRELLGFEGDEIDEEEIRTAILKWDIIVCLSSHDGDSNDQNLGAIRWVNANTAEWQFGGGRDSEVGRDRDANIIDVAASPGFGHEPGRPQSEMLDYTTPDAEARFLNSKIACVVEASFAEDFSPPLISGFEGDPDLQHIPWRALLDAPAVFWTTIDDFSGVEVAEFHWQTLGDTATRVTEMVELADPYWAADLSREQITSETNVVDLVRTGPARVIVGEVYARDASSNENEIWAGPYELGVPEPWSDTQTFAEVDSLMTEGEDELFIFQDGTIIVLEPNSLPDVRGPIDLVLDPIANTQVDIDNIRSDMEYIGVTRDIWLETDQGTFTGLDYLSWLFVHYPPYEVRGLDENSFGLFRWNDTTDRWIMVGGNSNTSGRNILNFVDDFGRFGVFYWEQLDVGGSQGLSGVGVEPNPFSPNGDGLYEETRVTFWLGREADYVNVEFFDLTGRLVNRLEFQLASTDTGRTPMQIVWDGTDENGNVVPYGIYIMRLEAKFKTAPIYERVNRPVVVIK
jgi:hypothetical protein